MVHAPVHAPPRILLFELMFCLVVRRAKKVSQEETSSFSPAALADPLDLLLPTNLALSALLACAYV
jgi:hypothetical protein